MEFSGLQKMTLLDYPDTVACIVFTQGCNFRCPYCHNKELLPLEKGSMPEAQIWEYLEKRAGILEGICITGGEPLLQTGLEDFLVRAKDLGYQIKIDTNGSFPDRLNDLIQKNLVDYVAMDLKNSLEQYPETVDALIPLGTIIRAMEILRISGITYEFRTTITGELHSLAGIEMLGQLLIPGDRLYLQRYQESPGVLYPVFHSPEDARMLEFQKILQNSGAHIVIR